MRRGLLTLVVLLGASSIAAAQTQFFAFSGPPAASKVSADEVVARFMTFDSNGDGRICRSVCARSSRAATRMATTRSTDWNFTPWRRHPSRRRVRSLLDQAATDSATTAASRRGRTSKAHFRTFG